MKFTLGWLRTHLDTEADLATILRTLNAIGLEVESVTDRAASLAAFRIAHVVAAEPHPNADRLRACQVDAGGDLVSVVCGAPNARAGMKAVFAPAGSLIPGSGITLKSAAIRGVPSEGMLLSSREMGLGEDHAGIVELPADAPVGAAYAAWAGLDDPVIEIAVTPNRGDALSVRGIARDLAAAGLGRLIPWQAPTIAAEAPSPITWRIAYPEACPYVLGRAVRGVANGPSPEWLARRLADIGLRPINALADITNFFTFDLGRPLHVFDIGKLQGDSLTLRRGNGEHFAGLHGREVIAGADDCVIADAAGVQSLAGIVGGAASGCDAQTTDVFIECALFDPVRIALTGRAQQINSDARQRFERGVDPALLPAALDAATALIQQICGGTASQVSVAGAEPDWRREASLRFDRLRTLGGADVAADDALGALERLGFTISARDAGSVRVAVPSWRPDIAAPMALDLAPGIAPARAEELALAAAEIEAEADLVEEVLRLRGLDAIEPVSLPPLAAPFTQPPSLDAAAARVALARRVLASRGLAECVTFSFLDHETDARFGPAPEALRLLNPIAADLDQLRATPLATLAQAAARNAARGLGDAALFEIGPAFSASPAAGQATLAAGLRCGATARHWAVASRPLDGLDAKADALAVLAALGVAGESLSVSPDAPAHYHPGQSGQLRQGPKLVLARFGVLHPALVAALDLPAPTVGFEIFLDAIPARRRRRALAALSSLQPLRRDFAFLVGADVPAGDILRAARGAERNLITAVTLFDLYQGEHLPAGQKSVAIEVTLQPRERSLTDAEIEAVGAQVVAAVAKATGARLRG